MHSSDQRFTLSPRTNKVSIDRRIFFPFQVAAALLLLILTGCGGGASTSSTAPPVTSFVQPAASLDEFETRLETIRRDLNIPGVSAAIVHGQTVVWTHGFGFADVEGRIAPTPDTSFHLASLTKTYASTVILQLVEEGRVSLDDPVSKYGINLASSGTIRVRHLLSHTSEGVPGAAFQYNPDRYQLLEGIINQVAAQSFGQRLVNRILAPLALRNTAPNVLDLVNFALTGLDRDAFILNMAKPYQTTSGQIVPSAYPSFFGVAAGLISSASDVAQYSMALDRGALISDTSRNLAFTQTVSNSGQPLPYGLGWFVQSQGGVKLVWHYGLWTANSALIIKVPERGLTLILLANSERLTDPYPMAVGDVMVQPMAREFVNAFVLGSAKLP
jgi:CubicO group peptidase (beta-lactamase class C family)